MRSMRDEVDLEAGATVLGTSVVEVEVEEEATGVARSC